MDINVHQILTCANMTCDEKCCSHEHDWISDHCCSNEEYERHLNERLELPDIDADHHWNPNNFEYDPARHIIPDEIPYHETTYKNYRWHHFNLVASLIAAAMVTLVLLTAVFFAVRYRRKYSRIKKANNVVVRHYVGRNAVTMDETLTELPLASCPNTSIALQTLSTEKQSVGQAQAIQSEREALDPNTPPSYNDIVKDESSSNNKEEASTSLSSSHTKP